MMSGPGHAGDMPNLHVPVSGALDLEVLNASITLEKDKPSFSCRRHCDRDPRRQGRLYK
jgi:Cu/Zn superoxide dismutase